MHTTFRVYFSILSYIQIPIQNVAFLSENYLPKTPLIVNNFQFLK